MENLEISLLQIRGNLIFSLEHYIKSIDRCMGILNNITQFPNEEKYKKIKIKEMFTNWYGIIDILLCAGFKCILDTGTPYLIIENVNQENFDTIIAHLTSLREDPSPLEKEFINIKITQLDLIGILCLFHINHTMADLYSYISWRRTDVPFMDMKYYLSGPRSEKYYFTEFELIKSIQAMGIGAHDSLFIHQVIEIDNTTIRPPEEVPNRQKNHDRYVELKQKKMSEQIYKELALNKFKEDREKVDTYFNYRVKNCVEVESEVSEKWQKNLESRNPERNILAPPIGVRREDGNNLMNINNNEENRVEEIEELTDEENNNNENNENNEENENQNRRVMDEQ